MKKLLENCPITGWCQAFFFSDVIKCKVIDDNMCETFNGVILDSRSKPIISMLEDIRQYVITRIVVKREYVRKWDNSRIPCQHAMASIAFCGADSMEYVSHWFRKDTYLKAYESLVNPVKGREFRPSSVDEPMLPPMVKRMPGRPIKKRRREPLECKNKSKSKSTIKLTRAGRVFKYRICSGEGHNKLTCPRRNQAIVSSIIVLLNSFNSIIFLMYLIL